MINNWVSSSKELQLLVDDYLLTVNYRSVIENDLVNYTQGIESYFRNERLTLRDKINKFIEELPESYRELLSEHVGNTDDWIGKLVSTRVFLTHGDRENMAVSNPYKLVHLIVSGRVPKTVIIFFFIINSSLPLPQSWLAWRHSNYPLAMAC